MWFWIDMENIKKYIYYFVLYVLLTLVAMCLYLFIDQDANGWLRFGILALFILGLSNSLQLYRKVKRMKRDR